MEIPLIPDLNNPKWLIVQEILKTIGSKGCGTKLTGVQVHQIMPDTRTF
jgi:hypothetical protein